MSTFTALNGASSKLTEPPAAPGDKSSFADERLANSTSAAPTSAAPEPQAAAATPQRDTQRDSQRDSWTPGSTIHVATYPLEVEGSHKRKRSASIEMRREFPAQERTPDTATVPTHADARDHYGTPQRDYRPYGDEQRERDKETWYSHQARDDRNPYDTQQNSAISAQGSTDDQIGEALRRATSQMDHSDYTNTSPDGDDRSILYGSSYSDHRGDSILQHDPKKRKRNFSNRTKTGCLTCRKRKKKCDEQKPECKSWTKSLFSSIRCASLILTTGQASTVFEVDLYVRAIRRRGGQAGKSQTTRLLPCHSNPKTRAMCLLGHMACRSLNRSLNHSLNRSRNPNLNHNCPHSRPQGLHPDLHLRRAKCKPPSDPSQ